MTREEAIKELTGLAEYLDKHVPAMGSESISMAIQALREKQNGGWISVKDRLPKTETPVLVTYIATDGEIHSDGVAALLFGPYWYWWEGSVEDTDQEVLVEITHWQPLPEPPKGE